MNNKTKQISFINNCNVVTIGHVHHGKSATLASITQLLYDKKLTSKALTIDDINSTPEEKASAMTINLSHASYMSPNINRHYTHIDAPGHEEFMKNAIVGMTQVDIAIVCISVSAGIASQTEEHLRVLYSLGMKTENLVFYITKMDTIPSKDRENEFIMLKHLISSTLEQIGFEKTSDDVLKKAQFLWGAPGVLADLKLKSRATEEDIKLYTNKTWDLINSLDNIKDESFKRNYDDVFRMSIEKVVSIKGRGKVFTGTIKSGSVKVGDKVTVLGYDTKVNGTVIDIEVFHNKFDIAKAGYNVGMLCRMEDDKIEVRGGMLICSLNSVKLFKKATIEMYIFKSDEGGRKNPFKISFKPVLYINTGVIAIKFLKITGGPMSEVVDEVTTYDELLKRPIKEDGVYPGYAILAEVEFNSAMPLYNDLKVILREGKSTIGRGKVVLK
jgi:elongation factor Tu